MEQRKNCVMVQPNIVPVSDRFYRLDEDYTYEWAVGTMTANKAHYRMTVFKGFIYDGATVPRFGWTLTGLLPDGMHRAAALIHDWLYRHGGKLPYGSVKVNVLGDWQITTSDWSRRDSDKLFCRILRESGVSKRRRRFMYFMVRTFGKFFWGKEMKGAPDQEG